MYAISDKQIDFILNDIGARGVKRVELQTDLLDHVCCIIEAELEEDGDFDAFYLSTIKTFYQKELLEIEEETNLLLTFKHYYSMKKAMNISGFIAVSSFLTGCLFKFLHWPVANILLMLGILIMSLGFLPLLFVIKSREADGAREKWIHGLGTLSAILVCISALFKILHWPYASILSLSFFATFIIYLIVFGIAAYRKRINGTRPAATILLISMAVGLQFAAQNTGKSTEITRAEIANLIREEQLLTRLSKVQQTKAMDARSTLALTISSDCQFLKDKIIATHLGGKQLSLENTDFSDIAGSVGPIANETTFQNKFAAVKQNIVQYNTMMTNAESKVPVAQSILDVNPEEMHRYSNLYVLQSLIQLQLFLTNS